MTLNNMFEICKEYNDVGCNVQEQLMEVYKAHYEFFPGSEDEDNFLEVVNDQNQNALKYGVDMLNAICCNIPNSDSDLEDEIINFVQRIEDALEEDENDE